MQEADALLQFIQTLIRSVLGSVYWGSVLKTDKTTGYTCTTRRILFLSCVLCYKHDVQQQERCNPSPLRKVTYGGEPSLAPSHMSGAS